MKSCWVQFSEKKSKINSDDEGRKIERRNDMSININRLIEHAPVTTAQAFKGLIKQSPNPFIELHELCKNYGKKLAVDHLNLAAYGGEVFGFLGPNGAGKTTTIKMIVGLLQPTTGTVTVAGYDMQKQPTQAKFSSGYVPDNPNLYSKLSPRELLQFVGDLYCLDPRRIHYRIAELLELFNLTEVSDDLIDSFSHGMQQKVSMSAALLHDPKVLILDEPTVGLDPKSAHLIKDVLRQFADRGSLVFITTHILEIAERMCDRVGILDHGKLVAIGTIQELRSMVSSESSLEDIFLNLTGAAEEAEIAEVLK
jgi:ABC-2 type transport system ATP-binding protein